MYRPGKYALHLAASVLLLAAAAAEATGFLSLESSPSGAEVWYTGPDDPDKKYLGDTPLEHRELPVGRYNLWLILASHDTLAIPDVYVAEGQVTQMNRDMPTHYGYLEVNSEPDSAEIWLDGVRIGPSPYVNNLVLPGVSRLKVMPRESHFRNSVRSITMGKGDSVRLSVPAPYRDKAFMQENLSLPTWRFQLETGVQFRSNTGSYDSLAKKTKFSSDSLPSQWDFPFTARLGLPQGFEAHLLLPFKSSRDPMLRVKDSAAVFPSNMRFGVKYTLRPYNVGFDVAYAPGFKSSGVALDHDYLALTLIAMASQGKILGEAQAGWEFHFASKKDNKLDPGDLGFAHAQIGYLVDPFVPYLGLTGRFRMDGDLGGKTKKDGGYILIPEPGLLIDIADILSLQFGVPFTVAARNDRSYWGIHLSLAVGLSVF